MPGCSCAGEHKAPKHRGLNDYYYFCVDHIREYNQAWDFFSGMSADEVQNHILQSVYGFRPTWKYGVNGNPDDILRDKAWHFYGEETPKAEQQRKREFSQEERQTPEYEALAIMGLEAPITLPEIKVRYKELAKKHHPDLNKGDQKSEELLKRINMAYTILKLAYKGYEDLGER